ncbi:hypothetical protein NQ314_003323 [Rhamnusium bicolor]|uniref:Uncharacterized protein n=1 Tax=Rhamnusium bicolor TaxID=1586634 RepID=A0AAV8ZNJ0_9CUCU|nr:hypothetical protein NQ314_003323 [Rhamnusium bicolor]
MSTIVFDQILNPLRWVQSRSNFRKLGIIDAFDVALTTLQLLPALAFAPVGSAIEAFEPICDENGFPCEVQPVVDYFEDTWILGRL